MPPIAYFNVVRGQRQTERERAAPHRRTAPAPLHRAHASGRARGTADGRALLCARPDCDAARRGPDAGPQREVLHRHRHPQHAAGGPGLRLHRLHVLKEFGTTKQTFTTPKETDTENYISGPFGRHGGGLRSAYQRNTIIDRDRTFGMRG
jgi:hypothetical protein